MKISGFTPLQEREVTKIFVAKHPELKGYVIKIYLDTYRTRGKEPPLIYYITRAKGAALIQTSIDSLEASETFKTPRKWIYPLPEHVSSSKDPTHHFLLIVEDMGILPRKDNCQKWKCLRDHQTLDLLHTIVKENGLHDSLTAPNIPFCHDGKIAFVDTAVNLRWPVRYSKLDKYLNPKMRAYWQKLSSRENAK